MPTSNSPPNNRNQLAKTTPPNDLIAMKLPEHIERMLTSVGEVRRQEWLAKFGAMTPAEQQAALDEAQKFEDQYGELPEDWDVPLTEAEMQEVKDAADRDQVRRNLRN